MFSARMRFFQAPQKISMLQPFEPCRFFNTKTKLDTAIDKLQCSIGVSCIRIPVFGRIPDTVPLQGRNPVTGGSCLAVLARAAQWQRALQLLQDSAGKRLPCLWGGAGGGGFPLHPFGLAFRGDSHNGSRTPRFAQPCAVFGE